ncbi:MAG: amino acid ABC transporter ATP-binding protein [Clostridiales bacterium]|nr:amino acid ABC transporter ATP-binding protein [Clostridiales bacterium]
MITIRNVSKAFGGKTVFENISARFAKNERIAIIGQSGVGKSVFLRCLNGLERPDSGEVRIAGDRLFGSRREHMRAISHTGMVFQQFNLFSHLNVIDNIALALIKTRHTSKAEAFAFSEILLGKVGLPDKRFAYPSELSGGQQQRIGIARALALNPDVLLFDEPTSALDPSMKEEVLSVIADIALQNKLLIIVTHELQFAHDYTDRILFFDENGVYEEGPTKQMLQSPKREKTIKFLSAY